MHFPAWWSITDFWFEILCRVVLISSHFTDSDFQWRRQGSEVGGQSWSVGSPCPPFPVFPSFLSLFPSPSFLTFLPLLFFFPSFLPKIHLEVWGSTASSPQPGAEPRPPKHFCHILRPEDVLAAVILVLFAQIKISIWLKIGRTGCYPAIHQLWLFLIGLVLISGSILERVGGSCPRLSPSPGDVTADFKSLFD